MSYPQPDVEPWHRVHITTPLVRSGRALIVITFVLINWLSSGADQGRGVNLIIHLVSVVVLVVYGFIYWLVTRWRIEAGTLRIETGVLRRSSLRFPLDQIQAVDTVRSGLARVFGVSELRLRMAGHTGKVGRLAYLKQQEAEVVRARLLALAHGVAEHSPEPAEQLLASVPVGRLVLSIAISGAGLVVELLIIAVIVMCAISPRVAFQTLGGSIPFLFGFAINIWRRFNSGYNMTVAEAPDGLRVRSGLVETSAETIPRGRIQAVRLSEPLVWRWLGWCRLEVSVAGQQRRKGENQAEGRSRRTVLPVGDRQQAQWLLSRLVPDAPLDQPLQSHSRVRFKAPLSYRFLSWQRDDTCAVTSHGRLERVTDWVPLGKVQSLRVTQGPLQRRMRLANIHLDTAGSDVFAKIADRDESEISSLVEELIDKCRKTRRPLRAGS